MWLMATVWNGTDTERFHRHGNFYWTALWLEGKSFLNESLALPSDLRSINHDFQSQSHTQIVMEQGAEFKASQRPAKNTFPGSWLWGLPTHFCPLPPLSPDPWCLVALTRNNSGKQHREGRKYSVFPPSDVPLVIGHNVVCFSVFTFIWRSFYLGR